MQLTFLGTAAANAYPEAFCQCEHCCLARQIGGKNLRLRASALVNDDLVLDLGPDIHAAAQRHSISLLNVRYCLQTHPHADHLDLPGGQVPGETLAVHGVESSGTDVAFRVVTVIATSIETGVAVAVAIQPIDEVTALVLVVPGHVLGTRVPGGVQVIAVCAEGELGSVAVPVAVITVHAVTVGILTVGGAAATALPRAAANPAR